MKINMEEFDKVEVRTGTIKSARPNKRSKNAAYVLEIDFGPEIGVKKSSAQITEVYKAEDLIGKQVVACINLIPIYIGSVKSEVRILGTESEQGIVLLVPEFDVKDGDNIA